MITTSKKLKIDFAPLDIVLNMQLKSPTSGLIQTYDVASAEYEPDRSLAAQRTIIQPVVKIAASDGSIGMLYYSSNNTTDFIDGSSLLTNMKWLVNGEDIANSGIRYDIGYFNQLIIMSNIPVGTTYTLQFTATILDKRKNVSIPVESELMYLTCNTKSEEILNLSVTRQHFSYDVMHDKLALYDYKVCRGIISENATAKSDAMDGNEYLVTFPYIIKYGDKDISASMTINLTKYDEESQTWINAGTNSINTPEVTTFTKGSRGEVVIDCRLLQKLSRYRLSVSVSNGVRNYTDYDEFTVKPTPSDYDLRIRNDSSLNLQRRLRHEDVIVTCDNVIKEYPAAHLNLEWSTDKFSKVSNCGADGIIDTFRADGGNTAPEKETDTLEVSVAHEPKGVYCLLTNGESSGQYYTSNSGEYYIID